ncbi:unnamed protein product [Didymodactylos carnosus]|uniref:Uncharacterized protein n=1 Tax=Didymodactylos carnosus TaxID=1234261 RepID=A0A814AWZ4_9BILA|nr:unnamed protein product [Didymodactylos carnosus]CAF3700409.1 unnamed protein product [Didymodactylos carnosus]
MTPLEAHHNERADFDTVLIQCLKALSLSDIGSREKTDQHDVTCDSCHLNRKQTKTHLTGHAVAHFTIPNELFGKIFRSDEVTFENFKRLFRDNIHENVTCNGCSEPSFRGLRFKCDICPDYDLCQRCASNGVITGTHKSDHPIIIVNSEVIPKINRDDIELGDELGHGGFGYVYKSKWLSKNRVVACKVLTVPLFDDASERLKSFMKELAAYRELSGAYILKIFGYCNQTLLDGKGTKYMLILEYMERGSLTDVLNQKEKLSLHRKLVMALNIASGMRKIHDHRMIHRDIRPDNILVSEDYTAKIGDMGIARVISPNHHHTIIGCQKYMPYEFYTGVYDQSLDVYTFGLTLNHLFTENTHNYDMVNRKAILTKQSPVFWELISRCIDTNPRQRPSAVEIEKTLGLFDTGFNQIIRDYPTYKKLPTNGRDKIFLRFYEELTPKVKQLVHKPS